jgi:hypothetical protein
MFLGMGGARLSIYIWCGGCCGCGCPSSPSSSSSSYRVWWPQGRIQHVGPRRGGPAGACGQAGGVSAGCPHLPNRPLPMSLSHNITICYLVVWPPASTLVYRAHTTLLPLTARSHALPAPLVTIVPGPKPPLSPPCLSTGSSTLCLASFGTVASTASVVWLPWKSLRWVFVFVGGASSPPSPPLLPDLRGRGNV